MIFCNIRTDFNFIFGKFSVARKLILNGGAIRPIGLLLMQCSRYTEFREVIFNKSSNLIDNFYSYSDNEKFVSHKYVSQFIENAYNKRKRTLYN